MKKVEPPSISELINDNDLILKAVDKAVHAALRRHKLLGESIVVWEDGKVKIIPPEQIPLPEDMNFNGQPKPYE